MSSVLILNVFQFYLGIQLYFLLKLVYSRNSNNNNYMMPKHNENNFLKNTLYNILHMYFILVLI